jgi:prophage regulatory protein
MAPRLIRLPEVITICSLSRTAIYDAMKAGKFPLPVKTTGRSSAWIQSEIETWIQERAEERPYRYQPTLGTTRQQEAS